MVSMIIAPRRAAFWRGEVGDPGTEGGQVVAVPGYR